MSDNGILIRGLDGSNPLAFLAALGTLRTLTLALPDETVRMSWEECDGAWRPRVWCSLADNEAIVEQLHSVLAGAVDRISFSIGENLNLPAKEFRSHLVDALRGIEALHSPQSLVDLDFFAAFGSEVITNDDGTMQDTALRTMSGAGHQHFLKFIREITSKTDIDQLRRALLANWDYADEGRGLNLRWDPLDDRRYALRWEDPSGDPVKTMRGANRLAIEAMPLLPTMPTANGLATTAFEGKGARGTYFVWPIWKGKLSEPLVRSLLTLVPSFRGNGTMCEQLDIPQIYSSARITIGKFRNFTPSAPAGTVGLA
jgi:hypothetical protein